MKKNGYYGYWITECIYEIMVSGEVDGLVHEWEHGLQNNFS